MENNQLNPPPDEIDLKSNKSMWVIDEYKIWANTYIEAIELYNLIKND